MRPRLAAHFAVLTTAILGMSGLPAHATVTAPELVQAQGLNGSSIQVLWSAVPGATSYSVYRDSGSTPIETGASTLATDTGLAPQTNHDYTVTANVDGSVSSPSAPATASTQGVDDTTPPTQPGMISVSRITAISALLTWPMSTDNVGVEGYRILVGPAGALLSDLRDVYTTDAVSSYTLAGLRSGTAYEVAVVALDSAGNLSTARTTTFTSTSMARGKAPLPPTSIVATPFSESRIDLTWGASPSSAVAGYQVTRDGVALPPIDLPVRVRFSDDGLTAGTSHAYTIRAISPTGVLSPASAIKNATTLAAGTVQVARGPYTQAVTASSARVAWWTNVLSQSVVAYGVSSPTTTLTDTVKRLEHVMLVGGLRAGTTYKYLVGDGATSATGSVTTAPAPGTSFSFAAIGDFGGGSGGETQNASLIAAAGTQFVQTLGDNIYPESADPDFAHQLSDYDTHFFRPFQSAFANQAMWPANGNKEYYGSGAWFRAMWTPNNQRWYAYDWGDAHILVLDTNQPFAPGTPQFTFAQNDLSANQSARWRIVVMEQAAYSSSSNPRSDQRRYLAPLFEQEHVALALTGNSHNYERTLPIVNGQKASAGVTWITSGAGGNGFNHFSSAKPSWSAFREDSYYESLRIMVSPNALRMNAVRADTGGTFDTTTIH
jgi:Fibronectin type III domain